MRPFYNKPHYKSFLSVHLSVGPSIFPLGVFNLRTKSRRKNQSCPGAGVTLDANFQLRMSEVRVTNRVQPLQADRHIVICRH